MYIYKNCDKNTILILLFLTVSFGLSKQEKDARGANFGYRYEGTPSDVILSTLLDSGLVHTNEHQRYKRNVNEHNQNKSVDEQEAPRALQSEASLDQVSERALEFEDDSDDVAVREVTVDRVFPGGFTGAVQPKLEDGRHMLAERYFPGEFSSFNKMKPAGEVNPDVDGVVRRIETDLHGALQVALKQLYSHLVDSVHKGHQLDLGTRQTSAINHLNTSHGDFLMKDKTESDLRGRNLLDRIHQPSIREKASLGSAYATGETDITQVLRQIPTKLFDDIIKIDEIGERMKEDKSTIDGRQWAEKLTDNLLSLISNSKDLSSRAVQVPFKLNPIVGSDSATELVSPTYLSNNDLAALLKLLSQSDDPKKKVKSDCKDLNPIYMYLVNVSPDKLGGNFNSKIPIYNNRIRPKPRPDSRQFALMTGRAMPKSDYRPLLDPGISCGGPNAPKSCGPRDPVDVRRMNKLHPSRRFENVNSFNSMSSPSIKDILYKLESSNSNTFNEPAVYDDPKSSLVHWLYEFLPFNVPEFDLIPHFEAVNLLDDINSRQLIRAPSQPARLEKRCHCQSSPSKYITNLLRLLETKPVTKSEFINYLMYIVNRTKSEPMSNEALLNEDVLYDNSFCDC